MPLGVFEIGVGETRRVDAFEDDSRVGRKGWDRRVVVAVEAAVAQAVFGGDTAVDAQEPGRVVRGGGTELRSVIVLAQERSSCMAFGR